MRRRPRERDVEVIATTKIRDNQTWNDCPECGKQWETIPAVPGIIHRTRLCDGCLKRKPKANSSIM